MNFWAFDIGFQDVVIIFAALALTLLISNMIRRKIGIIRKSLLPTAVIGGIIILIFKNIINFDQIIDINSATIFLEALTYHALALGFIAVTLKNTEQRSEQQSKQEVMNAGLITVNTYLIQAITGVMITIGLHFLSKKYFYASGFLLPLGYGQGSGQALNFGSLFETEHNFVGGASFGLTIAAIGFLVACIGGVIHILIRKKQGKIKIMDEQPQFVSTEIIASPNEVPATESIDRFTLQSSLIVLVYFLTFLFMYGVEKLPLGNLGTNTIKPLIWGFNFLIGSLMALLVKQIMRLLKKHNIMTREYANNYLLNRISGFMFDIMIIAGIAAIEISVLKSLILPLLLITVIGLVVTYLYTRRVTYFLFPHYKEEMFVALFGMLTGTTSTGMILLREVDPTFKTPAAHNLVYLSFYAIAFGFPLFLLLGIAPQGLMQTLISLGVAVLMFIFFNLLLFRKQIFKQKTK